MIWLFFMEGPKGPFGRDDYCGDGKWGRERWGENVMG